MKNFWENNPFDKLRINKEITLLVLIILLGAFFRLYGLNWDQNQHLHPDERFLTMVTQAIKWPSSISEYFSTDSSPLNPHNANYGFFVYGTFPIFLTKFFSEFFKFTNYNNLTLFGRFLSGIFDTLTILLIFLIGKKTFSFKVGLLASFFYAVSVLPIQLSHFYATDIFLNFFLILSFYLIIKYLYSKRAYWAILSGLAFGLAMASKINAVIFSPALLIIFILLFPKLKLKLLFSIFLFCFISFISFKIFQPYAFSGPSLFDIHINPKFIQNLQELNNSAQPGSTFPPAVQWNNTAPILYPLKNMILWGLGLPLGIISLFGIFFTTFMLFKKKLNNLKSFNNENIVLSALILTTFAIFIYQGLQVAKPMRYFITIYPLLSLMSGYLLANFFKFGLKKISKNWLYSIYFLIFAILLIWPLAFFSIYTKPHSRVAASEWIYKNILNGSVLGVEHWDDALPLTLDEKRTYNLYKLEELPMFAEDSEEKWTLLKNKFQKIDYIVITSNRAYGSVPRLPEKYPKTIKYYNDLFSGNFNFKKVAEFTSRPSILGFEFIDDNADEVFTVYDHPKVSIFKKDKFGDNTL